MNDPEELLTVTEAAKLLKLHPKTVIKLALNGDIPAKRYGRSWRFKRSDLVDKKNEEASK